MKKKIALKEATLIQELNDIKRKINTLNTHYNFSQELKINLLEFSEGELKKTLRWNPLTMRPRGGIYSLHPPPHVLPCITCTHSTLKQGVEKPHIEPKVSLSPLPHVAEKLELAA